MGIRTFGFLLLLMIATASADESVRQAQEELRRRNLYFGDVDGRKTPEFAGAVKRYQERKGFTPTGTVDGETAKSLNIRAASTAAGRALLPDVPVLKSDMARELPAAQRIAYEQQADVSDMAPTPPPPAESPGPGQDLSPAEINALVEQYLRDAEKADIPAQTRYFSYPVEYFDHGAVGPAFVEKDVTNYCKHWPDRKYMLTEPPTFVASGTDGETLVEFPIAFSVRNRKNSAAGKTKNFWTLRKEGDELKIVAIREQRIVE
jgi:peptidoglycan hydrolase-like protein with peptidoglycan-binding domain